MMPKIGWWILIGGGSVIAIFLAGFIYLVTYTASGNKSSNNASASVREQAGGAFGGIFNAKPKRDEAVAKLVRDEMYDESGARWDVVYLRNSGFFQRMHALSMGGHSSAVYDLAMQFNYPGDADLNRDQRDSMYTAHVFMDIASEGGDYRGSLFRAAQEIRGAQVGARSNDKPAMLSSLDAAQRYVDEAAVQGGPPANISKLQALVDDLRHRDARAFAALAGLIIAGISASGEADQSSPDAYAVKQAEESARLREEQRRFHCAWQGRSTEYAQYGDWAGC